MRCRTCGTDNAGANSYCTVCGAQLTAPCRQCGQHNYPTARFCGSCGGPLDTDRLATAGNAERKQGTVLFADIVGSTQLIAQLDPEQAMERLRPAVEIMSAAVRRYDGAIMRILGDGIMAVFGAPRAQEGHAFLACEAALAIQDVFKRGDGDLKVRIGLHSGEFVMLYEDSTREPVPHGATLHLASRLEQMAEPGAICLTWDCYRLVRPHCEVRPLGPRAAKGFAQPIEVYSLLRLKTAVASQQFRISRLASFRGREQEIQRLRAILQRTEDGDARVVGISGPAGAGKSRVCYEFSEWCRGRSIPVLEARASVYGHATHLNTALEFLRAFFNISQSDDAAAVRRRIAQHPSLADPTWQADIPLLFEVLGVTEGQNVDLRPDPKRRHTRFLNVVRHIVKQIGTTTSLIIIEDLHWLDRGSEEFVAILVEAVAHTRAMLVVNFRQSYAAPWMSAPHYEEMPLPDLDAGQTSALVEELTGNHRELRYTRQRIVERSGGNPFFAEELVRSLADSENFLQGEYGNYRTAVETSDVSLPATVHAVLAARIDRLPGPERKLLQIAAIIGKEFPDTVLQQVAGMADGIDKISTSLQCRLHPQSDECID